MKAKDETGNKYGRLTVLYRDIQWDKIKKDKTVKWVCQCDCGNLTSVNGSKLRSGHTQSCGCLQKERAQQGRFINEKGNKYGKLTVLEFAGWSNKRGSMWKCQCDCGNIVIVEGTNLRTGNTKSCGCIRQSYGEERTEQLLNEYNISFIPEYSFKNLVSPKGNPLRFDFCILKDNKPYYFIECDGLQHINNNQSWPNFDYETLKIHDKIKETYLQDNNFPLIRIPYEHYNKIKIEDLLLTSSFRRF